MDIERQVALKKLADYLYEKINDTIQHAYDIGFYYPGVEFDEDNLQEHLDILLEAEDNVLEAILKPLKWEDIT